MRLLTTLLAATTTAALVTAAPALAGGGSFGINMDAQPSNQIGGKPASTYGAAAGQPGFWNTLFSSGPTFQSLTEVSGAQAGVTVQRFSGNNSQFTCVGGIVSQDWSGLMCDYAWDVAGVVNHIEYEFNGLPAGTYQVYTYGAQPGETFVPSFFIGLEINDQFVPGSGKSIGGTVLTQQFTEGKTHVVHTVTLDGGDSLRVIAYDGSGEFGDPVAINGIQIVSVGEPEAVITSPDFLNCACDPVLITGTAAAGEGGFAKYTLEWSADGNAPWNLIQTSSSPVTNGVLASWDASNLAEGYYVVRLTSQALGGKTSTATTTVYLDKSFDPMTISPQDNQILGGNVCVGGTIWDHCYSFARIEYKPASGGSYQVIDPSSPSYLQTAINQTMGVWSTDAGPTSVADGSYNIRVTGHTTCGNTAQVVRQVTIDNTPPLVVILSPGGCTATGCDPVQIVGTVFDANIEGWSVQYTGGNSNGWVTIGSGTGNVSNGVLATFDPTDLPACCYTIRVVAHDKALVNCNGAFDNRTERLVTIDVGLPGDVNGDGAVNSQDLNIILGGFGLTCF